MEGKPQAFGWGATANHSTTAQPNDLPAQHVNVELCALSIQLLSEEIISLLARGLHVCFKAVLAVGEQRACSSGGLVSNCCFASRLQQDCLVRL